MLSARDLLLDYRAADGGVLSALGPLSFQVAPGSFVCLLGPSGGGKSTLIRILAGLLPPTAGQVYLDDVRIAKPSNRVGLMFQDANLMPWRTVIDNIALSLELAGVDKKSRLQKAVSLLPALGLGAEFAHAYPAELSGGMAQRVALGRVLIQRPDVLLLDEPFGALDAFTREQISLDLMQMWSNLRPTVVMVTHNIDEAILLADRVLILSARPGRIIADIPITLPRPRRIEDSYRAEFGQLAAQIRRALQTP
ncbi:MAG: ABC transporter ATP-binding protein [Anaerolineae bacterium]|nr:ABC transporter ATP-binding protein [Anaerolineae bacterium]